MKKSKLFIRSLLIVCRTLWSHVNSNILVDSDRMTVILHNSAFCASKSDTMESMNLPESPNQLKLTYFFWQKKSPQTTNNATHLFESLLRKPFSAHSFLLELFAIFSPLISTGAVCHFRSTHFCCSCVNKPLMKSTYCIWISPTEAIFGPLISAAAVLCVGGGGEGIFPGQLVLGCHASCCR